MERSQETIAKERAFFENYLHRLTPKQKQIYEFCVAKMEENEDFMAHVARYNTCDHDAIADDMYKTVNYKMCLARTAPRFEISGILESAPMTIFDIGCGQGYFSYIARISGHTVYSLDLANIAQDKPIFHSAQQALKLNMFYHTIKPFTPLPTLPSPCDLIVIFQPHFYNPCENQYYNPCYNPCKDTFWHVPEWKYFLQDLIREATPEGQIFFDLNKVQARPDLYGFGCEETRNFFLACGARWERSRVFFDSVAELKQRIMTA